MAGPSLMIALGGKPKDDAKDGDPARARAYAREAFSAVKDDDEDGFIAAFLGAIRAGKSKPKPDDAEESDDHEYDE